MPCVRLDGIPTVWTVPGVRWRLWAVMALAVLWVPALVVLNVAASDSPVYQPSSEGLESWIREAQYLDSENFQRQGTGNEPAAQVPLLKQSSRAAVRVLVVGDSATFGTGARDLDMVWPQQLQRILDRTTGQGVFDVKVLAQPGASLYRYADWVSEKTISLLRPDLIVIALNRNDVVPLGTEGYFCKTANCTPFIYTEDLEEYNICMDLTGSLPAADRPSVDRRCRDEVRDLYGDSVITRWAVIKDPTAEGYGPAIAQSVKDILTAVGSIPVGVFPVVEKFGRPYEGPALEEFADAGAVVFATPHSELAYRNFEADPDFKVHPYDNHPGPIAHEAMARDVAQFVLKHVPEYRLAEAKRQSSSQRALVSNFLPTRMQVSEVSATSARLQLPPSLSASGAGQHVPCADIQQPHIRVMFNPMLTKGEVIRVTASANQPSVTVFGTGYVKGRYSHHRLGELAPGSSLELTLGHDGLRGVLLAAGAPGCARELLDLEPAGFSFTLLHSGAAR